MLDDATLSVRGADGRTLDARILTALLDTSLSGLTVGVHLALRANGHRTGLAAHEGIAGEAVGTRADRIVVDDLAAGVDAARSRARVLAALGDTGEVVRAVRVGDALGLAGDVRIAAETREADAGASVALVAALGVRTARARIADVDSFGWLLANDGRYGHAGRERVAGVPFAADADRHVVGDAALGVRAARVGARVLAPVAHAALVARAVRVQHALRPARRVRIASVVRRAFTFGRSTDVSAFGVQSTRRRVAGLLRCFGLARFSCFTIEMN